MQSRGHLYPPVAAGLLVLAATRVTWLGQNAFEQGGHFRGAAVELMGLEIVPKRRALTLLGRRAWVAWRP